MSNNTFELLPVDILFEIFLYLSPVEIVQSFLSLNKRFSSIVMYDYMWHIHINGNRMPLSTFNDFCQNMLKLIEGPVISLRLTLTNAIHGWSLVSSSLKSFQIMSLRRLHLIDIETDEFDELLNSCLLKQLNTLLIDITDFSSLNDQIVQGAYLAKVCSALPVLRNCRLPFNYCRATRNQLSKYLLPPLMTLPNLCDTIHLRRLTTGINTSEFLERLLECIPFIENLSVGVYDDQMIHDNTFDTMRLPSAVNASNLRHLSRLKLNCISNISFHRSISLLSSVFGQLSHLSLKLEAYTLISGPLIVSGDTIQQLCLDRLKSSSTYTLNLSIHVGKDLKDKIIYNSFVKSPFISRKDPSVVILEDLYPIYHRNDHRFIVYTVPYSGMLLEMHHFYRYPQISSMTNIGVQLFPHISELLISAFDNNKYLSDLDDCKSSTSQLLPWSLLTKITINNINTINATQLEAILGMAYNVDTLEIFDHKGLLPREILRNTNHLGTRINQQVCSLHLDDDTLTIRNVTDFCMLLSDKLTNLKELSFGIFYLYDNIKFIKSIINVLHILVNRLQQLISLHISFSESTFDTQCFPDGIRQELYENPLSRPNRLQCCSGGILIWL